MTTEITVFEPSNMATIAQSAPIAYAENKLSHDRCIQFGQQLLDRVKSEGMSDDLDREIATFIERAKKTLRKMNGKRSAITQIFDNVRSAYTRIENAVDPAKKGTVAAQLQEVRNKYAAAKREQYEAEQRRRQMEQAKAMARSNYMAEVEEDLLRQFNALVASSLNGLVELDRSLTADNYAEVSERLKATSAALPAEWYTSLRPQVMLPSVLSPEEARALATEAKQKFHQRFTEQYEFEISTNRDDILDRLPSKRRELERIAKAEGEKEAARIKAQMEERERREAEQRERERAERLAKEKAAAELAAQKRQIEGMYSAAATQACPTQPGTTVKKRISVLNPEGFMQVVGMWWAQHGCTLSVAELEKEFRKQLNFCNRLANDKEHPVFIQSEHIEYVDDVKAK